MRRLIPLAAVMLAAGSSRAQDTDLEKRIRDLEIRSEKLPSPSEPVPEASLGLDVWFKDGLHLATSDGAIDLRIGGYLIHHSSFRIRKGERYGADTFEIEEAHLEVHAKLWKHWEVFVAPNLLPGGGGLHDGWVEFNGWDLVRVRAGQFRVPHSQESREPTLWQDFPEDSLLVPQAPDRDLGVMVHGLLFDGICDYAVGVFNGNGSSDVSGNRDENSDKDVVGYFGVSPFATAGWDLVRYFRVGIGATDGRQDKPDDETPFEMESPAAGRLYTDDSIVKNAAAPPVSVEGERRRYVGELALGLGPFDLKTEYAYSTHEIEIGEDGDVFRSFGNNWSVGWWFGGTRAAGNRPKVHKGLFDGGYGALQIVARYSKMHTSKEYLLDGGFGGTNHVREWAVGLNWYPTSFVRISAMYQNVKYGDDGVPVEAVPAGGPMRGPGMGGGGPGTDASKSVTEEDLLIFRVQIEF
ncbi:MAG: hypothetical protein HYY18_20805 [Planctomycetes bacterium]|nr:hypothetical protein [Planctomycetota bacterium]